MNYTKSMNGRLLIETIYHKNLIIKFIAHRPPKFITKQLTTSSSQRVSLQAVRCLGALFTEHHY